jgi:hypothetical protein
VVVCGGLMGDRVGWEEVEGERLDLGANLEENFEVMEPHLCQTEG